MSIIGDAIDISLFRYGDPCPVGCGGELQYFDTFGNGITFLCSGCAWSPAWAPKLGRPNGLTGHQAIAARRRHEQRAERGGEG